MTHQYARAEQLLVRAFPIPTVNHDVTKFPLTNGHAYPVVQFSTVHPNIAALSNKGKGRQMPEPVSPSKIGMRLPVGPSSMVNAAVEYPNGASRLVDMSVACRYLAALCQVRLFFPLTLHILKQSQVRQGKWHNATEMLGESNPFRDSGRKCPQDI
jgi:anaphase-promoting complex subunit 6